MNKLSSYFIVGFTVNVSKWINNAVGSSFKANSLEHQKKTGIVKGQAFYFVSVTIDVTKKY